MTGELFIRGEPVIVKSTQTLQYTVRWEDLPQFIRDWMIVVVTDPMPAE